MPLFSPAPPRVEDLVISPPSSLSLSNNNDDQRPARRPPRLQRILILFFLIIALCRLLLCFTPSSCPGLQQICWESLQGVPHQGPQRPSKTLEILQILVQSFATAKSSLTILARSQCPRIRVLTRPSTLRQAVTTPHPRRSRPVGMGPNARLRE